MQINSENLYYKDRVSFFERRQEFEKTLYSSPNFVPIIIEKNSNSTLPILDKNKYKIQFKKHSWWKGR